MEMYPTSQSAKSATSPRRAGFQFTTPHSDSSHSQPDGDRQAAQSQGRGEAVP